MLELEVVQQPRAEVEVEQPGLELELELELEVEPLLAVAGLEVVVVRGLAGPGRAVQGRPQGRPRPPGAALGEAAPPQAGLELEQPREPRELTRPLELELELELLREQELEPEPGLELVWEPEQLPEPELEEEDLLLLLLTLLHSLPPWPSPPRPSWPALQLLQRRRRLLPPGSWQN